MLGVWQESVPSAFTKASVVPKMPKLHDAVVLGKAQTVSALGEQLPGDTTSRVDTPSGTIEG